MRNTNPTASSVFLSESPPGMGDVILEEDFHPILYVSFMSSQSIESFAFPYPLNIYSDSVHPCMLLIYILVAYKIY